MIFGKKGEKWVLLEEFVRHEKAVRRLEWSPLNGFLPDSEKMRYTLATVSFDKKLLIHHVGFI
jgi:hypothetical protein